MMEVENKKTETRKEVSSVVSKPAEVKKKNGFSKFKEAFISEDARDVKSYILSDVLIPTIKRTIADMVSGGIDMLLYGEVRSRKGRDDRNPASRVSYRKYYDDRRDERREPRRERYEAFDYDNLEFDNRGDAELVLSSLDDIIEQYGTASVADLYDLAGVTSSSYITRRYGWTSLAQARVISDRGVYYIDFPKAIPLE